jgi:hypothetical protein
VQITNGASWRKRHGMTIMMAVTVVLSNVPPSHFVCHAGAGHHDALAAMTRMVELLKHLEHPLAQITPQQASICRKAALLAIGDHIGSGVLVNNCYFADGSLWSFVSRATRHRMTGPKLQGLYLALKAQRQEERERGARQCAAIEQRGMAQGDVSQGARQKVAACVEAVEATLQQEVTSAAAGVSGPQALPVALQGVACSPHHFICAWKQQLEQCQMLPGRQLSTHSRAGSTSVFVVTPDSRINHACMHDALMLHVDWCYASQAACC